MNAVDLVQGTDTWKEFRATRYTASCAPNVLGKGYKSRNVFLRDFGRPEEPPGPFMEKKFRDGHIAEAGARARAEEIAGTELLPVVAESEPTDFPEGADNEQVELLGRRLAASFDGIDFDRSVIWEHKLWNPKIQESLENGEVPLQHRIQMEQQMMLSGADRGLFMISSADQRRTAHQWVEPDMELRIQIIQGWFDFHRDLNAVVDVSLDSNWIEIEEMLEHAEHLKQEASNAYEKAYGLAMEYGSARAISGKNYSISKSTRSGSISYAKVLREVAPGIDLELYRGPSTESFSLKRSKK